MPKELFPQITPDLVAARKTLAPDTLEAFKHFSDRVFADGALPARMKEIIAVAVAHVTQCPYCIRGHTRAALRQGATGEELMEAIWVASEMRAGAAYAHSALAVEIIEEMKSRTRPEK
jgi:AhpD family alkylhydroperoxidase